MLAVAGRQAVWRGNPCSSPRPSQPRGVLVRRKCQCGQGVLTPVSIIKHHNSQTPDPKPLEPQATLMFTQSVSQQPWANSNQCLLPPSSSPQLLHQQLLPGARVSLGSVAGQGQQLLCVRLSTRLGSDKGNLVRVSLAIYTYIWGTKQKHGGEGGLIAERERSRHKG